MRHTRFSLGSHGLRFLLLAASLYALAGCATKSTKPGTPAPTEYYVDVNTGLDGSTGTPLLPFKTITRAIAVAGAGAFIHVAPGIYDTTSGEVFPILLQAGQTLMGDTLTRGAGPTPTVVTGIGVVPGANPGWIDQSATILGAPARVCAGCGWAPGSTPSSTSRSSPTKPE